MKHEARTTCCNHTFKANDIKGKLMSQMEAFGRVEHNLYGGNAERFAHTVCPECETKYVMWMKRQSPNFRVLTISKIDEDETESEEQDSDEDEPEPKNRRGRKPQTA